MKLSEQHSNVLLLATGLIILYGLDTTAATISLMSPSKFSIGDGVSVTNGVAFMDNLPKRVHLPRDLLKRANVNTIITATFGALIGLEFIVFGLWWWWVHRSRSS
jgi:hypothetical protein